MGMDCMIRPARSDDVQGISRVVISALRETNAKDYPDAVIARVEQSFSPAAIVVLLERRDVFVAVEHDRIVGTASLDGRVVRTVFIEPRYQGRGIGRALMAEVERSAVENGVAVLAVPSSVTAERFYAKLGFRSVRDSYHGEERTIVMERLLLRPIHGTSVEPCRGPCSRRRVYSSARGATRISPRTRR
jgi:GNAT superfamily N-acetyltransferase